MSKPTLGERLEAFIRELPPEARGKIHVTEAIELLLKNGEDAGEVTVIYDSRHRAADAAVPANSASPSADDSSPDATDPPTQDEEDGA